MSNVIKALKELMDDPKIFSIISEISVNPGINVKQISETLSIGKSILYTRIQKLEELNIISSHLIEKDGEKKSKVPEKIYFLSDSFDSEYHDLVKDTENQIKNLKELRLFHLYQLNSLIQREIRIHIDKSLTEIQKQSEKDGFYGGSQNYDYIAYKYAQKEIRTTLKKIKEEMDKRDVEEKDKRFICYYGFIKLDWD